MRNNRFSWWPAAGFAVLWIGLSLMVTGTTFHLAPLIVAAAIPVAVGDSQTRLGLAGAALAATVAIGLSLAGYLAGPSLLPTGGALVESLVFAGIGGVIGILIARATGRLEPAEIST